MLTNPSVESGKSSAQGLVARIKGMNLLILFTVVLPTLLSAFYFGFIASDTYISESSFVIRGPEQQGATSLGMILKGAGFTRSQDDGYAVQDFILSRDALRALNERLDIRNAFASKDVISLQRLPVTSGKQVIKVISRRKPAFAGIDPYNKYIDRNSDDNVVAVTG